MFGKLEKVASRGLSVFDLNGSGASGSFVKSKADLRSREGTDKEEEFFDADEAVLHPDAHEDGGLACRDSELLARQRSAIIEVMKSLAKNLLTGHLDLLKISLPVKLFEPRSYLQKLADPWVYPAFLQRAAAAGPVERMQWVVTYIVAGYHRAFLNWAKPFNPILGETWQASLSDGTRLFMEQISHHPPLSAFQMFGPNGSWCFHGVSQPQVSYKANAIKTSAKGHRQIIFHDGSSIYITYPHYNIKGLLYSDSPRAEISGIAEFLDKKNGLMAILHFGQDQRSKPGSLLNRNDTVTGTLYAINRDENFDVDASVAYDLNASTQAANNGSSWKSHRFSSRLFKTSRKKISIDPSVDEGPVKTTSESASGTSAERGKDGEVTTTRSSMAASASGKKMIGVLRGNWLSHVDWDGVRFWTLVDDQPLEWKDDERPLPSDSRFREDLQALALGDLGAAQLAKETLENRQRADAKLR